MTDHLKMIKDPSSFQIAVIIRTKIIHSSYLRMNLILHHLWIIFSPRQTPSNSVKLRQTSSTAERWDRCLGCNVCQQLTHQGRVRQPGRKTPAVQIRSWSVSLAIFLVSKVCPTIASFNWCEQQLAMWMTIIDLFPSFHLFSHVNDYYPLVI